MYEAIIAMFGLSLMTLLFSGIAFYILLIIAAWKIFTKAGIAGWKSLIPLVNIYYLFKISWNGRMGVAYMLLHLLTGILNAYCHANSIMLYLSIATGLVSLIFHIVALNRLSKSFGHGTGWTFGLFFLPNIFTLMLGFGKSKYSGPADN